MDTQPERLGVAVSGGGDSIALLTLMQRWARSNATTLEVISIDHGLRPESAGEAVQVQKLCDILGVDCHIARWGGWSGTGNLQDAARQGRRDLIRNWAAVRGLDAVALGHTLDDQAETVLMRLARGSGVDGLSGMAAVSGSAPVWIRPLLGLRRAELRQFLTDNGIAWIDDPSNDDPRFDRVRARKALNMLGGLGIDADGLVRTAKSMSRARHALEAEMFRRARTITEPMAIGCVRIDCRGLLSAPEEISLRLLAHCLVWVSGAVYRPRLDNLTALHASLKDPAWTGGTLHGCLLRRDGGLVLVSREPGRTGARAAAGGIWDGKWQTQSDIPDAMVAELGANRLVECPDARIAGWPMDAIAASPAFFVGEELIAAPFAKPRKGCHVIRIGGRAGFFGAAPVR